MQKKYFRIKNLERYIGKNHKKNFPWIKLPQDHLDDQIVSQMTPHQYGIWVRLIQISVRVGIRLDQIESVSDQAGSFPDQAGSFPDRAGSVSDQAGSFPDHFEYALSTNQIYLRRMCNSRKPVELGLFADMGLIEFVDIIPKVLGEDARGEQEEIRGEQEERRGEQKKIKKAASAMPMAKPLPPKSDSTSDQKVSEFIKTYCEVFKARYGFFPDIGKKNAGIAKRIVAEVGIENAKARVKNYLEMNDSWFLKKHHDLSTLENNLNAIKMQQVTGKSLTNNTIRQFERKLTNFQSMQKAISRLEGQDL